MGFLCRILFFFRLEICLVVALLLLLSDPPHAVMLVINASNMNLQDKNMERALLIDFEFLDCTRAVNGWSSWKQNDEVQVILVIGGFVFW